MFGILFVPKIVNRIQQQDWVSSNRLSAPQNELVYINLNGENKKVPDFVLTNQDSLFISNEDYLGKVYLIEFFFTTCTTICPIMNIRKYSNILSTSFFCKGKNILYINLVYTILSNILDYIVLLKK